MNNKNIFFEEDFKLYYGPKKENVRELDLINHEETRLDNFQIKAGLIAYVAGAAIMLVVLFVILFMK